MLAIENSYCHNIPVPGWQAILTDIDERKVSAMMDDWDNTVHLSDEAAAVVLRYADQGAITPARVVGESISTYRVVKESIWKDGQIVIVYPDGRASETINFPDGFGPPLMPPEQPKFLDWFINRPILFPVLTLMIYGAVVSMTLILMSLGGPAHQHQILVSTTMVSWVSTAWALAVGGMLFISERISARKRRAARPETSSE